MVNETIKAGNSAIVAFGCAPRMEVDLDVYVFSVLPRNYSIDITRLETSQAIVEYSGALHMGVHYHALQNSRYTQLIPEGTLIKIAIQPLNLTITVELKLQFRRMEC